MASPSSDSRALYEELLKSSRELGLLGSCAAVLGWDEQTYMPPGASSLRGDQMALLAGIQHDRGTDPRLGELLENLHDSSLAAELDSIESANVRQLRRDYARRIKLPRALVEDLARTTSLAQQEWVGAKHASDFARFRPWLDRVLALKRQESACLLECLEDRRDGLGNEQGSEGAATIYDPLLDEYEQGARTARLRVVFGDLRESLSPFVKQIAEAGGMRNPGESVLRRRFPIDRQRVLAESAAAALGFDFQRGRLDVTEHPFCTGIGSGDVRVTTKYDERRFDDAFFSVLHEVGHGLYEQGLPTESWGTPAGESVSLGVHESQSRLWENFVGRSRSFWSYWFPVAHRTFHDALHDVTLEQFLGEINRVEPSLIRIQADEVTYNLHVLIRFDLELALLSGDLATADLPEAWNAKYAETLGVTPANDAEGCLQDVHWAAGLIGYFPTYTLGNIYAAQLYARATADLPGLEAGFARGESADLLAWLRDKIHRQGRRYAPTDLIERAVGGPIDAAPLMAHLRRKYGELYGLSSSPAPGDGPGASQPR
ncbi:carboxypeptidase M32 [Planctomyces sp. SH-PL62]|uniref:carboxypeptidase M32 n=1 Tax=Planctomyces sp. SH-PL62 TaxID=1636152 RepID=UPI00078DA3B1|nr:carboxypeptidase M32 [Planctomyces sp. SH-PL62]AMV37385.1 Thermostable carboxypeptidase 1 [Planctomyces sp. SH-PL62]